MVEEPKRHAVDSSQNEFAEKQEETSGGQLVEALLLLGTVEDGGGSRSTGCRSTRLERGTLNGSLGASAGRLGDKGASRSNSDSRGNGDPRGGSDIGASGGTSDGASDGAREGNGDAKSSRRGLRGVAGSRVRAADSLGLCLGLGLGSGS